MPFPYDDEKLTFISTQIRAISEQAYQILSEGLLEGIPLEVLLDRIEQLFGIGVLDIMVDAISISAGISIVTTGPRAYKIDDISLSSLVYDMAEKVSRDAKLVINDHLKGYIRSRNLALDLFEGYDFREEEVLKVRAQLPKYLKRPFAQVRVEQLRTPALRAAYLALVKKDFDDAQSVELLRVSRTAWFEKARYFADRVARTETARAINHEDARALNRDEQLEFIQVKLSAAHPVTDICDLHAGVNRYGLGPGVYPKAVAPLPPYHPHCFCRTVPRYDLTGATARDRPGAERAFIRRMRVRGQGKVMGSREKAGRLLDGEGLYSIIDEGKKKIYRTVFVGDFS